MPEVKIVLRDKPDGMVGVEIEFDPVLKEGDIGTPAQDLAVFIFKAISKRMAEGKEVEDT